MTDKRQDNCNTSGMFEHVDIDIIDDIRALMKCPKVVRDYVLFESPIDWHSGEVYTEYRRIGNGPDTVAYLKEVAEDDLSILLKGNTP